MNDSSSSPSGEKTSHYLGIMAESWKNLCRGCRWSQTCSEWSCSLQPWLCATKSQLQGSGECQGKWACRYPPAFIFKPSCWSRMLPKTTILCFPADIHYCLCSVFVWERIFSFSWRFPSGSLSYPRGLQGLWKQPAQFWCSTSHRCPCPLLQGKHGSVTAAQLQRAPGSALSTDIS